MDNTSPPVTGFVACHSCGVVLSGDVLRWRSGMLPSTSESMLVREIKAVFNAVWINGKRMLVSKCPVCGTQLFREATEKEKEWLDDLENYARTLEAE